MSIENHPNLFVAKLCTEIASVFYSGAQLSKNQVIEFYYNSLRGAATRQNAPDIEQKAEVLVKNSVCLSEEAFQEFFLDWLIDVENCVDYAVERS